MLTPKFFKCVHFCELEVWIETQKHHFITNVESLALDTPNPQT